MMSSVDLAGADCIARKSAAALRLAEICHDSRNIDSEILRKSLLAIKLIAEELDMRE